VDEARDALASFEDTLLTAMLFGLDHNQNEVLGSPAPDAGGALVKAIEQYLQAHALEPVTMQTLAEETEHSIASIYRAFRKARDYSPMQYLRSVRLGMARRRLLAGQPGTTVSDIALNCGFFHFGRFSAEYKRRFGECPSTTVERTTGPNGARARDDRNHGTE
jgi:transcriptional regulator GlxA family with amidase domain